MTTSSKKIKEIVNSNIAKQTITTTDAYNLIESANTIENIDTPVVETFEQLPPANQSQGRFFYIEQDRNFKFSNGEEWISNFNSTEQFDSDIYTWGSNEAGQLGDGTAVARSSPVSVVGGFSDWFTINATSTNTGAIRTNGTLWTWGCNFSGNLGDNTTITRSSPVSVVGGFTDWCLITFGSRHTAAIRTNGTLWTWGNGVSGGLGIGCNGARSSPVSVVGGFTDWCSVSVGFYSTIAIRTNCTLWAWGCNGSGLLGDGTNICRSSPVSVVGGFTDWCAVSLRFGHAHAIRTNGTLWSWGYNFAGKLGDGNGTTSARSSPVSVVGGFTDWCTVSAGGGNFSAAIRTNGTLWTWGQNNFGQLGDSTLTNRSSPVSVVGGFTDWCAVSAGNCNTAAIRTNGTLWMWGTNTDGRIGNNTSGISQPSPVSVVGGFTDWCAVSVGSSHAVAIRTYFKKGF